MSKFITNQDELLSDVANDILPTTKTLKFLVGYFYFSGFKEIYENVEDKNIKILIGLEAEAGITSTIKEVDTLDFSESDTSQSNAAIRQQTIENIASLINSTDILEDPEAQKAFDIFVDKIAEGTLEIKKTKDPNHAKLYLFEKKEDYNEGGQQPGTLITGSSNLSVSGLKNQFEINVSLRDKDTYQEADTKFEQLWENAIEIVDETNIEQFEKEVIDEVWIDKTPDPYKVYIRILSEYFAEEEDEIKSPSEIAGEDNYYDLKYQIDAIKKALESIKKHDGVIIADVVGLGKSIVASTVAHNLNLRTVVIAPPHLEEQWEDYEWDFGFSGDFYSSGKIDQAYEERGDDGRDKLIIVDEAHAYRNEDTNSYASLHKLCQGNKVMLLSATPFNNKPQDIKSLIKLFQIPGQSTIRTVGNLSYRFRKLEKDYKEVVSAQREDDDTNTGKYEGQIKKITAQIQSILDPVIVRRSRLDLKKRNKYSEDLERQGIEFSEVKPPRVLDYELGDLTQRYEQTLDRLAITEEDEGFIGARYKPTDYINDWESYKKRMEEEFDRTDSIEQAQRNNANFMKRLLVRRFESSIPAFFSTLNSIQKSSKRILEWYDQRGEVPVYKKGDVPDLTQYENTTGESIDAALDEEITRLTEEKGMEIVKQEEMRESFREELANDIELLEDIKDMWRNVQAGETKDPKLESLKDLLAEKLQENPDRKIIIFTEYNDTAEYLKDRLQDDFAVFKYSSSDSSDANKSIIKENFDAGVKDSEQSDEYDILVATDAISEGYNLNRAGIVFNYDIPYNPTRIIQRVGRINRINKKVFDNLYIYNSFPSATGERETRTKQIATLKMSMIQELLGEDTQFLTPEENPQRYNQKVKQFQEETKDELQDDELSWDTKFQNDLDKAKSKHPELVKEANEMPNRVRIGREITGQKPQPGVLLCAKKAGDFAFGFQPKADEEITTLTAQQALELFRAAPDENGFSESDEFYDEYDNLRANIFNQDRHVASDSTTGKTISMIDALQDRSEFSDDEEYLKDLRFVVSELDSLPDRLTKAVRTMELDDDTIEESFRQLQEEIPHEYLVNQREHAKEIEEGKEEVILAEEFKYEF
jgi:superfamily II DNA/RNA helicase